MSAASQILGVRGMIKGGVLDAALCQKEILDPVYPDKEISGEFTVKRILALIPVFIAGFYFIGLRYHQGFLDVFGIEESLFPLSIDRTLLDGFIALFRLSSWLIAYSLIAALVLSFTAVISALYPLWVPIFSIIKWFRKKFNRKTSEGDPLTERILLRLAHVSWYVIYYFLLVVSIAALAHLSRKSGQEWATSFKEDAVKNNDGYVTLSFATGTPSLTGKTIYCSASHCAYWLCKEKNAIILRNEIVDKAVLLDPSLQGKRCDKAASAP